MGGRPVGEGEKQPLGGPAAPEGALPHAAVREEPSPAGGGVGHVRGPGAASSARARRRHRILVTAIALSPLVALVILVVLLLRTIEHRAAGVGQPGAAAEAPAAPGE